MLLVQFDETELSLIENHEHEFLLSNKDVAIGYGVSIDTIRSHLSKNQNEFIEGKHYIVDKSYKNTRKIFWTKKGIVRLGFFIKSESAKKFRDWAEDYIVNQKSSNQPDLQKVISGLKSGMLRKDKKIEKLENEIQQLRLEHQKRVAIPHFNQNQKIDIILRNTENLLKQDGILPFQDMAKARFDFMRDYIEAIRTGGTKLEQFTIDTIEDYKNKYIDESKRRVLVEHKYNLMIERVREYIKVANQLSLLEPIGGAR